MKKLMIILSVLFIAAQANAQENTETTNLSFTKGTKVAQVGIGLGGALGTPIGGSFEMGVTEKIGVGAYVGFSSKTYPVLANEYRVSNILIGARGNYHFYTTDKIDAYGGVLLGYNAASAKWTTNVTWPITATYGGIVYAGYVGGRYYFTEKIGAFAELGYGLGYLNIGAAFKL